MKRFLRQHLFFPNSQSEFNEDEAPDYLLSKDFKWWWDDHVLTLEVGEYKETDFNRFTRIA